MAFKLVGSWNPHKSNQVGFRLRTMSSCATLLEMLSAEKLYRCEKSRDVPDRDGSKPFVFSIDGKDLQASNRKGADWDRILTRTKTYVSKGDLTQQFAAFKRWLESDRRTLRPHSKKLRFVSNCAVGKPATSSNSASSTGHAVVHSPDPCTSHECYGCKIIKPRSSFAPHMFYSHCSKKRRKCLECTTCAVCCRNATQVIIEKWQRKCVFCI